MTVTAIQQFTVSFHSDIASDAQALDMLREHAFVERFAEILIDYGEVDHFEPCHWQGRGMKVDGYAFDDEHVNLTLVVSHWLDVSTIEDARVINSELDRVFKRGLGFFEKSIEGKLKDTIDVSNPAQELAALIHECRDSILSVRIIIVTDGVAQERHAEEEETHGVAVSKVIWDIQRANNFVSTGEREQISIDFENDYDYPIPCVEQQSSCGSYFTYLSFVSGDVLADLYAKWKIRLLERNVRVFLSQRPKVNQGIRDTIREEPSMFCAYNNGLTVYAQGVDLIDLPCGSKAIARARDFQIVNGGQTTASLYHTREKYKCELDDVVVQLKLFVINDKVRPGWLVDGEVLSDALLPKIGRFSNTQNRIQMADLLANDPPHPELYAISVNLAAPDPTGGSVQTYWFYERSRGSYDETRRLEARTRAQQKKFDQKFPRKQRFDKNKFGKSWNSYRKRPHEVCLGAMKNFARFNAWLGDLEHEDWNAFFKKTVALVLLWNETERMVRRQKFGGYTHAIVAYSLAWYHHLTDLKTDLDRIWTRQCADECVLDALEAISQEVNNHIRDTKLNVTEWCKKEECWTTLLESSAPDLPDLTNAIVSGSGTKRYSQPARSEKEDVEFCIEKGADAWFELAKWLKERDFMQGKQRSQSFNMGRTIKAGKKEPSGVLSHACKKIWETAEDSYGWVPTNEN